MSTEIQLKEQQTSSVDQAFAPLAVTREGFVEIYKEILTAELNKTTAKQARELRLKLSKHRKGIDEIHKTQKAYALAFGRYCDAWKKKETTPISQMIDKLSEIEKHEELKEKKRLEQLQKERVEAVKEYLPDADERDLTQMDDEIWQYFFETKKKAHLDRIEAERKKEEERLAEQKKLEKENKRLRETAKYTEFIDDVGFLISLPKEEYYKKLEQAKLKADAFIKQQREEAERKAREEAERKEKERKEKAEREAELKAEQEKRKKLEAELKAKREAEERIEAEKEALRQASLAKGDSGKMDDLVSDIEALKTKYAFKSEKYQSIYSSVIKLLLKITLFIENKIVND